MNGPTECGRSTWRCRGCRSRDARCVDYGDWNSTSVTPSSMPWLRRSFCGAATTTHTWSVTSVRKARCEARRLVAREPLHGSGNPATRQRVTHDTEGTHALDVVSARAGNSHRRGGDVLGFPHDDRGSGLDHRGDRRADCPSRRGNGHLAARYAGGGGHPDLGRRPIARG